MVVDWGVDIGWVGRCMGVVGAGQGGWACRVFGWVGGSDAETVGGCVVGCVCVGECVGEWVGVGVRWCGWLSWWRVV